MQNAALKKLDGQNRLVIPQKMLKEIGVDPNSFLKVVVENGTIILRPIVVVEREA